jgi:hypothetical protein
VLATRIGVADEEDFTSRLVPRHEHQDGFFLIDAGQVQQVAVLTVFVVHVERIAARRCAPEDRHRVRSKALHRAAATGFEIPLQWPCVDGGWNEGPDQTEQCNCAKVTHEPGL